MTRRFNIDFHQTVTFTIDLATHHTTVSLKGPTLTR